MKRLLKAIRRCWSAMTQPGTGGLIQPGDWRVLYPDGQRSRWLSYGDAYNLLTISQMREPGGCLEWRGDHA